ANPPASLPPFGKGGIGGISIRVHLRLSAVPCSSSLPADRWRHPTALRTNRGLADYFNERRPAAVERLVERAFGVGGLLDAEADAAHRVRPAGEIARALEAGRLGLAARVVVVDPHYEVDLHASRGFQLGHVIVEAGVAGETDHRQIGQRGFPA